MAGLIGGMVFSLRGAGVSEGAAPGLATVVRTSHEHPQDASSAKPPADHSKLRGQGDSAAGQVPASSPAQPPAAASQQAQAQQPAAPTPTALPVPRGTPATYATFDAASYLRTDKGVDAEDVSVGLWVHFTSSDMTTQRNIHMLASTRHSGCSASSRVAGWSFYVNEWETSNQALRLEFGTEAGCEVLASDAGAVPLNQWAHVGFSLQSQGPKGPRAMLFVDGKLVASRESGRRQATSTPLTVGATADTKYAARGQLALLTLGKAAWSPRELAHVRAALGASDLKSLATSGLAAIDLVLLLDTKPAVVVGAYKIAKVVGPGLGEKQTSPASGPSKDLSPDSAVLLPATGPGVNKLGDTPKRLAMPFDFSRGGNQWHAQLLALEQSRVKGTTDDVATLAAGTWDDHTTPEQAAASDKESKPRADAIRSAMKWLWGNYHEKAWAADELKPRTGNRNDNWGGFGFTLLDALDTLWVMDLQDEFQQGREWVANNLRWDKSVSVSMFETNIRALGGLLAAYDLSGDDLFLTKAAELADRLAPSFNTPTGLPRTHVNLGSGAAGGASWTGGASVLAEVGTLQVEWRYLARATGKPEYAAYVEHIIDVLQEHAPAGGLWPIYVSTSTGEPTSRTVTFGAMGDSYYEYLLKTWMQGGRTEERYRDMYDEAMRSAFDKLLKRTSQDNLAYFADWNGSGNVDKMDHLVCFVPGMLALGALYADGTGGSDRVQHDLQVAKAMMYTCWQMYERNPTGLPAEYVDFPGGSTMSVPGGAPFYILRPEAAESLFILHQLTGHPIYREWGWKMWQAIEKYCKTTYGYGAFPDVRDPKRQPDDRMESFFLAETMKYLYMLQSPDHPISLAEYVFNTEAHPLRAFKSNAL